MKEHNVIGTMQLLAACQRAPRLRKLVVRSSTAAYGASFRDPAVFTEDTEPREVPRGGFAEDILDIEGYVRGFRRRRPDVDRHRAALRAVHRLDRRHHADPLLRRSRSCPPCFGRDPRLQFLHVDDALEVLHRSVVEDHPGTYNVAGAGVLVAVPGDPPGRPGRRAGAGAGPVRRSPRSPATSASAATAWTSSTCSCTAGSSTPAGSIREFGFTPRSTAEAFDDFIRAHQVGWWSRRTSSPRPSSSSWTASGRSGPPYGSGVVTGPETATTGVGRAFDVPQRCPRGRGPARRNGTTGASRADADRRSPPRPRRGRRCGADAGPSPAGGAGPAR